MNNTSDWSGLTDANGNSYDPSAALTAIANGNFAEGYDELWQRVHHQGELGTAAYAVVPELVRLMQSARLPDWRAYALIATIDECRKSRGPSVPAWLVRTMQRQWSTLFNRQRTILGRLMQTLRCGAFLRPSHRPRASEQLVQFAFGLKTSERRRLGNSSVCFRPIAVISASS
jgi:hypothetical protein